MVQFQDIELSYAPMSPPARRSEAEICTFRRLDRMVYIIPRINSHSLEYPRACFPMGASQNHSLNTCEGVEIYTDPI